MSNPSRRFRAVAVAVAICCVLGVLVATPVLASSTLLRDHLANLAAAETTAQRDASVAEFPALDIGTISGLRLDPDWILATAQATDIPQRALSAYAAASLAIQHDYPNCNLSWHTLAAIGYVETRHGTIYGSHLGDDGVVTPALTGPALDGEQFKGIPDTDQGVLDGDTTWDRAVGPMQFIPQTWEIYGRDGNDDGTADPQHIDDAALAAAALLCARGGDLARKEHWIRAVHAYNQSIEYNHQVVDAVNRYANAAQ